MGKRGLLEIWKAGRWQGDVFYCWKLLAQLTKKPILPKFPISLMSLGKEGIDAIQGAANKCYDQLDHASQWIRGWI